MSDLPAVKGGTAPSYLRAYTCTVELEGSFEQLVSFLTILERDNPYLSVSHVNIRARADSPVIHSGDLRVSWPAWDGREKRLTFLRGAMTDTRRTGPDPATAARVAEIAKKHWAK